MTIQKPQMTLLQLLTPRQLPPKVHASPSGSVIQRGAQWLAMDVGSLPATGAALLLPRPLRPKRTAATRAGAKFSSSLCGRHMRHSSS
jgi:hypothetical protein